ncbi:unnamed protein product [Urochloa humidicola]
MEWPTRLRPTSQRRSAALAWGTPEALSTTSSAACSPPAGSSWLAAGSCSSTPPSATVGLALLLLGVFLIVLGLGPVANQFPGGARLGAAVADAVLFYLFAPGN